MKSLPKKVGAVVGCTMLATVLMSASTPYEDGRESGPFGSWEQIDNDWHFTYWQSSSEIEAIGWMEISTGNGDKKWYYFEPSGAMATGWRQLDGKWYYFQPVSDIEPGYKEVDGIVGKPYYVNRPGAMTTGWQYIDGKWYYFEPTGEMVTGWFEMDGKL